MPHYIPFRDIAWYNVFILQGAVCNFEWLLGKLVAGQTFKISLTVHVIECNLLLYKAARNEASLEAYKIFKCKGALCCEKNECLLKLGHRCSKSVQLFLKLALFGKATSTRMFCDCCLPRPHPLLSNSSWKQWVFWVLWYWFRVFFLVPAPTHFLMWANPPCRAR